jgi:hypothetical protein
MAPKKLKHQSRMVYAWRVGTAVQGHSRVSPQLVGETLEKIEAVHGTLKPALVIDEARPEGSALHPLFDWDDQTAAEKYRLHQARQVISSVVVRQVDNREIVKPISAFVNIVQDDGNRYVSTVSAMSDDEKRAAILRNAHADLMRWRSKYQAMQEFSELFTVIDRVAEAILEVV